jgi:hypothetical protein
MSDWGTNPPPATKKSFLSLISANPATIRIDNFEFQSNTSGPSERTADDIKGEDSFRIARDSLAIRQIQSGAVL